jgi:hypothetical protein
MKMKNKKCIERQMNIKGAKLPPQLLRQKGKTKSGERYMDLIHGVLLEGNMKST